MGDYTMKAFEGVKQNKYTTMVTKSITAFEKDVVSKTKPYATKAKPYIAPVVPYIEKAKPYAPKLALAAAVAGTIPMLFMFFFMSAITFPIWGFFALITSFIWVPAAFVATLVFGTCDFRCHCECHYLLLEAHWPCHPLQVLEENLFDPAWLEDSLHRLSMDAATFASENQ